MKIDKDILEVIHLAGIQDAQITDQILALADHLLKIHPSTFSAADAMRRNLQARGTLQ
jgi:hypothetical protein